MKKFSWKEVKENYALIKESLLAGETIVYPTDTIYGLGGNFYLPDVHRKIVELKKRSNQPFSAAVASLKMLEEIVHFDYQVERFLNLLPGPYTLVMKMRNKIREAINWPLETVGVRWIDLSELNDLINFLGFPLITTSVNISGHPPLNDPRQIARTFPEIDLLIDGGLIEEAIPSTVVDLSGEKIKILRSGAGLEKVIALFD